MIVSELVLYVIVCMSVCMYVCMPSHFLVIGRTLLRSLFASKRTVHTTQAKCVEGNIVGTEKGKQPQKHRNAFAVWRKKPELIETLSNEKKKTTVQIREW